MSPRDTNGFVEIPGPWQHRYVAANGARFHVAEAGPRDGGLVLLLHSFPEFWWAWRDQLPPLAEAGHRAVAMDLRGYGGSDKTPRGYDPATLAQDVAGVVKALGHRSAVLVGHGWGGYVGWTVATLHPREVSALCAVSAPHPSMMMAALRRGAPYPALRHLLAMQVPWRPERRIADPARGYVAAHLRAWSAPGSAFPDTEEAGVYQDAMSLWPAPHCALEYHRWLFRSRVRSDGRRFDAEMRRTVRQPVCCLYGDRDPAVPPGTHAASRQRVSGAFTHHAVAGSGHFPHEEDPAAFNRLLLDWVSRL
ncbi:MAG TPA: alpha/beta hydrolase [Nocardioidaceae bacterium]